MNTLFQKPGLFSYIVIMTLSICCNQRSDTSKHPTVPPSRLTAKPSIQKTLTIIPLGKTISDDFVRSTHTAIKKFLPDVGLKNITALPPHAYNSQRGRYRADSLIRWMRGMAKPNQVFLGITNVDISTTKDNYKDWGVMGLGYEGGNAAVASNYRLKNKSSFWKVAIHELGHTSGLPHCPVKTCFMRDAKGGDPTGEEKEFCNKCRAVLIQSGWKL